MTDAPILYLDTNHLSRLVRSPADPAVTAVRAILDKRQARLGLSLLHIFELGDPNFASRADVGAVLDQVPLAWAVHVIPELFDLEARYALAQVLGSTNAAAPPVVFYDEVRRAWNAPDVFPSPSEMIEGFAARPDLRKLVQDTTGRGALLDKMMKAGAAVVRDPTGPIVSRLREMRIQETPGGLVLPVPYPAETLLEMAGGIEGFPAYHAFTSLHLTRLKDGRFPTQANDLIDEWHAVYSPYVAGIALDRRTVGRCRAAKLLALDRITARLEDVPGLLAKAAAHH